MARFTSQFYSGLVLAVISIAAVLAPSADAQINNVADDTSTPIEGAGHDYIKALAETVNPANGSLSIRIQASPARARGITLPFSFNYDTNGVNHIVGGFQPTPQSDKSYVSQGGWSYGLPLMKGVLWTSTTSGGITCYFNSGYTFQDPFGTRHNLGLGTATYSSGGNTSYLCAAPAINGGDQQYLASLLTTETAGVINPSMLVSDADGTVYHFLTPGSGSENQGCSGCYSALPDYIEDSNGNRVVAANSSYTDSAGRAAITWNGLGSSGQTNTVTVSGMAYQVNWTSTTPNFAFTPNKVVYDEQGYLCEPFLAANTAETVVNSITLPNNEKYQFYYGTNNPNGYSNPYGLLSEIDYPTGAWVRYTWKMSDTYSEAVSYDGIYEPGGSPITPGACISIFATPVIASRSIGLAGSSSPIQTQTFTYNTVWNAAGAGGETWSTKTTTVNTTDNIRGLTSQTVYTYTGIYAGTNDPYGLWQPVSAQIPLENTVKYYDWGNTTTPLKTVTKTWDSQFELASEADAESGKTSEVSYTYGINASQVTHKYEYDYGTSGPGSLLRSTVTNYQSFGITPIFPNTASILDRPCQVITYDGSNNRYAETDYFYDNGSTGSVCGAAGAPSVTGVTGLVSGTHDETNYGPSSTAARGNLTQKTQWESVGTSPVTTYAYDETGQVLSKIDPCGNSSCSDMSGTTHTTTYSYADRYTVLSGGSNVAYSPSGATNNYLTQITNPLGQVSKFTYDYNNGQLTASQDQNDINASRAGASYIYNDPFERPTQVNYPNGGQTTLSYVDSSTPTVTTSKLVVSGTSIINIATADSLGRTTTAELSSDPDGPTYTATTYDGEGKVYTVSNPYRSTSDSTYGITTYTYDALGRTTKTAEPDGSAVLTTYDQTNPSNTGICTTVTDEVGNSRQSCADGLGRMTGVWEAPASLNYETDYAYNPLNNMLSVVQKGGSAFSSVWRTRTFTYDSLGRLLCAANPEVQIVTCPSSATGTFPTGAEIYTYDLNSNLATRVSPKAGQTGTQQTTIIYAYDVLNRLTEKSSANPGNLVDRYAYDGNTLTSGCGQNAPIISNPTNLVGRRSATCSNATGASWSYDEMGRPLLETSITNAGGGQPKLSVGYSYYLDGSISTITYPSGDIITYAPGGAGRPLGVSDSSTTYVASGSSNHATYSPNGALATMANGYTSSFAGIITQNVYNDRLQPIVLSAYVGSPANPFFSLCYDFHLAQTVEFGHTCRFAANSTGDNGNVSQILNLVDSTRSTSYIYDSLNRIAQAVTTNTTSANCWGQTFSATPTAPGVLPATSGIDAWGNLFAISSVSGIGGGCTTSTLNAGATTQNQLSGIGMTYDAAGNVTNDGHGNLPTYDAENRITSVAGVNYYYDADGIRTDKSSGTKYWYGSEGQVLTEASLSGVISEEYIYFNGQRIARVDRPSGTVHYYFSDHLSSTAVITDASGNLVEQYFYLPYGGLLNGTGSDPNHYKFTGKERDSESGLDMFGARYYGSTLGRFMTPDWAAKAATVPYANFGNPQSLNLYAYVENNPTTFGDSDGHCTDDSTICGFPDPGYIESDDVKKKKKGDDPFTIHINVYDWNIYIPIHHPYLAIALGHHGIPRAVFRALRTNYPDAYNWLNKEFVTGRLVGRHGWSRAHKEYNEAVRDLLKLDTEEGQAEVARDVLKAGQKVLDSDNPAIKGFLDNLPNTADGMTGREALQQAITEGNGEALGEFVLSAIGEVVGAASE